MCERMDERKQTEKKVRSGRGDNEKKIKAKGWKIDMEQNRNQRKDKLRPVLLVQWLGDAAAASIFVDSLFLWKQSR